MRLTIRTRLYGGFMLLLTFLLVSFAVSAGMLFHMNARMNRLILHDVEKVRMTGLLDQSILEITRAERNLILSDDQQEMRRQSEEIAQAMTQLDAAMNGLRQLATHDAERETLARITAAVEELRAFDREMQRLGMLNSNVQATRLSENEGRASLEEAYAVLERLLDRNRNEALLREMQLLLMTIQKDEIHMILTTEETGMAMDAGHMADNEALLRRRRDTLAARLTDAGDLAILRDLDQRLERYLAISGQVRALTMENGNHRAVRLSQRQGEPILARLQDLTRQLTTLGEAAMQETRQKTELEHEWALLILSLMLCLSFLVGMIVALRLSRDVNRGLAMAIRTVEAVARGDLDNEATLTGPGNRDEFDQLMQAMLRLVTTEIRVADMAQRLAREDLSVTVAPRSPSDRLLLAMGDLGVALRERAELRRMLLVAEKMSSIGQFAVRVAHEINNPLSTAAMGLQNIRLLLPGEHVDATMLRRLNQVENNIERATRVARQMLEFSWTGQPEYASFSLQEEVAEVLELVQADGRPVEIRLDLEEPLEVWGDRLKIGQVLRNLIRNALDVTPDHGAVRVSARREGEILAIQVRDWGAGLAPDVAGKIFEPFFTTKKSGVGVGLGLPICYSIAQQLGGTLEVTNAAAGGVAATLRLPISPPGN
ncbi:MAG: MCP four helix bundle domain-containing protein [Magnetococcales bacterium]|nr:MCP four helix bundle domain-containing protein [Magnetococcales bacterium]